MLAAVALWFLAPSVTLRVAAATVPEIVRQVAVATGRKLECAKGFEKDYLCIAVKEAAPDELLRHIAQACEGKWQADRDTLRLVPDHVASSRIRRQDLVASLEAAYAKDLARSGGPTDLGHLTREWDKSDPDDKSRSFFKVGSQLVHRFVRAQGVRFFASLESPSRVVFADTPTPFQRQTPLAGVDQWVAEWARQNNWYGAYSKTFPPDPRNQDAQEVEYRRVARAYGFDDDERDFFKVTEAVPPFRTLFVVESRGSGRHWSCEVSVRVFDRQGSQILKDHTYLSATLAPSPDYEVDTRADDKEISLSDLGSRHVAAVRAYRQSETVEPSDAQWVGDLVTHEPLAGVPSDFFLAMAEREGKNVVASLPDELIGLTLTTLSQGELTYARLAQAFFNAKDTFKLDAMKLQRDGEWWVATPRDPDAARADRMDRGAATSDLRRLALSDWPSLDGFATMYADQPRAACYTLRRLARPVLGNRLDVIDTWGEALTWLRLWGQLGPEARAAMRQGRSVALPRGTVAWQESAALLLSAGQRLTQALWSTPLLDPPYLDEFARRLGKVSFRGHTHIGDEPTESWQGALDASLVLACRPSEEAYFLTVGPKGRGTALGEALNVGELAYAHALRAMAAGQDSEIATMLVKPERPMQAGSRSVYSLWLGVQGRLGIEGVLNDNRRPTGPTYTLDTLPRDIRAEVERQSKLLQDSEIMYRNDLFFGALKSSMQERQTPPPCAPGTCTSTAN